jgi:serine/threonine protein kinase
MEYCDMGNLLTYQSKLPGKTFSLPQATQIIAEVMKGLKLIH